MADMEKGWRPIAEAPKDGTSFLAGRFSRAPVTAPETPFFFICMVTFEDGDLFGWTFGDGPTHWMPLPQPPEEQGRG